LPKFDRKNISRNAKPNDMMLEIFLRSFLGEAALSFCFYDKDNLIAKIIVRSSKPA
jgi:hypothetical protein